MQTILVILICGLAVGYLVWRFTRTVKTNSGSCCGSCEGCPSATQTGIDDWTSDKNSSNRND